LPGRRRLGPVIAELPPVQKPGIEGQVQNGRVDVQREGEATPQTDEATRERERLEDEVASGFRAMMEMLIEDARSGNTNPADKRRGRADRRSQALSKGGVGRGGPNKGTVAVDSGRANPESGGRSDGRSALSAAQSEVTRISSHGIKVGKQDEKPGLGFQGLDQLI
jgi:hypothetical protein